MPTAGAEAAAEAGGAAPAAAQQPARWRVEATALVGAAAAPAAPPPLSIVDRVAAPRAFMAVALAFAAPLDASRLRAGVERVLQLMPELACRAAAAAVRTCRRGRWSGAGTARRGPTLQSCAAPPSVWRRSWRGRTAPNPTPRPSPHPKPLPPPQAPCPHPAPPPTPAQGDWRLVTPPEAPTAGALLLFGASDAALTEVAYPSVPAPGSDAGGQPPPPPPRVPYADLGPALFPGLPDALPAAPASASAAVPLFAVAHYRLAGGGGVLGVRLSHMIGDFGTAAAALRHLAAGYSGAPAPPPAAAPAPGAGPVAALAAAARPLPAGFAPFNYLRPDPAAWAAACGDVFTRPAPRGVVYHVPPPRLAALKAEATADVAALRAGAGAAAAAWPEAAAAAAAAAAAHGRAASGSGGVTSGPGGKAKEGGAAFEAEVAAAVADAAAAAAASCPAQAAVQQAAAAAAAGLPAPGSPPGPGEWVSTHDALIAHVWRAVDALPSRAAAPPAPLTLGLDLRGRLDAAGCGVPAAGQARLYGNLATTAYVPAAPGAARGARLGALALEIRRSLARWGDGRLVRGGRGRGSGRTARCYPKPRNANPEPSLALPQPPVPGARPSLRATPRTRRSSRRRPPPAGPRRSPSCPLSPSSPRPPRGACRC
jgi:hypothetical protein